MVFVKTFGSLAAIFVEFGPFEPTTLFRVLTRACDSPIVIINFARREIIVLPFADEGLVAIGQPACPPTMGFSVDKDTLVFSVPVFVKLDPLAAHFVVFPVADSLGGPAQVVFGPRTIFLVIYK